VIERAFRAHTNEHWTRVVEEDVSCVLDERVVVVANAYADGWSSFWPEGSRAVLELFAERWRATRDLEASFAHVRLELPARASSLLGNRAGDDDLSGDPGASLLAARIEVDHVDVVWIGTQHLVVVRDHVVVARTQPDTLVEMGRAQGFDMHDSPHRHVITRTIRSGDILAPHTARFVLERGDRVIVSSEAVDDAIAETARDVIEKLPRDKFECVVIVT
jgi:hypothetical protein